MDSFTQTLSYKEQHERFVGDNEGSNVLEIVLATSSCPLAVFVRGAVLSWLCRSKQLSTWLKFLVDFLTLSVPGLLSLTLFSSRLDSYLTSMLCVGLLLFVITEKASNVPGQTKQDPSGLWDLKVSSHRPFITHFRSVTNMATAVCILAVDFPIFPRRFGKTETYGTGLMDVGVGGFVIANGIVSPEARGKFKASRGLKGKISQLIAVVKSTLPLIVLGAGRVIALKNVEYHEHVTEYGVHWNFFFTLAVVKVMSTTVLLLVPVQISWLLSLAVAVGYQYFMEYHNLREFILLGSDGLGTREGLLNANREGFFSCFGYLSMYLAAVSIGMYLAKPKSKFSEWVHTFLVLLALDVFFWIALYYLDLQVEPVSRRMGNLSYVVWMMAHQLLFMCCFFLVDLTFIVLRYLRIYMASESNEFCLMEAVNRNGLTYFLLSNIFTGIVNMSMKTIYASPGLSYFVLTCYLFGLSLVFAILHVKNITLRWW